jgi:hypothetical protein
VPEGPNAAREPIDPEAFARLQSEVTRLRLQIADEVRTQRVVIVDETGVGRIRLSATAGEHCRVVLLDEDGFERLHLTGRPDGGVLAIAGRSLSGEPTRVDVFAIDPEDDAGAYVGVELVDAGNTVAGFTAIEGRPPRTWTTDR